MIKIISKQLKLVPKKPGVYFFKNQKGDILYVGKAQILKDRVSSYFAKSAQLEARIKLMVSQLVKISWVKTDSEIEALILEAEMIKRFKPKYNIRLRDDKSYLYLGITRKEDFPRVFFARKGDLNKVEAEYFGPYTSARDLKTAVKLFRKIFPTRNCQRMPNKVCLWYHLGRCEGPCEGKISRAEYQKNIRQLILFLKGRKKEVILKLEKEMEKAAKKLDFEKARIARDKLIALRHLAIIWLATAQTDEKIPKKIECYDISNIMGKEATGSMVVFVDGEPDKSQYRQFKIKTVQKISDYEMLAEILKRRFKHHEWPEPNLVIIDGGVGQLNIARKIILEKTNFNIPIISIAKGPKRKRDLLFFAGKKILQDKKLIQRIRDEAHRFAIKYHRLLRSKKLFED